MPDTHCYHTVHYHCTYFSSDPKHCEGTCMQCPPKQPIHNGHMKPDLLEKAMILLLSNLTSPHVHLDSACKQKPCVSSWNLFPFFLVRLSANLQASGFLWFFVLSASLYCLQPGRIRVQLQTLQKKEALCVLFVEV